jgi:hypothetical protein
MQKKGRRAPKAFEPYTNQEVELILSILPTHRNVKNLAKALGRTQDAIYTIYKLAYSGRWLKQSLQALGDDQDNVMTKVGRAKTKLGIFVGHQPG